MRVVPVDVGILAYENQGETPALFRESRLPDEAEYIRPFIVMRSPRHARGTIRFELVDGDGDLMFVDETPWELKEGDTFIYPSTWLPMRRVADIGGEWQLRISAAGTMLAVHEFMWRNEGGGTFRAYLNGDGENDYLYGNDGADYLDGGAGIDILFGGNDSDTLTGGLGNDTLRGGDGVATSNGHAGYSHGSRDSC